MVVVTYFLAWIGHFRDWVILLILDLLVLNIVLVLGSIFGSVSGVSHDFSSQFPQTTSMLMSKKTMT